MISSVAHVTLMLPADILAQSIPSPGRGVWHIGPIPIRAYALLIICGIVLATWLTYRRYERRGGPVEHLDTVVCVAVIAGILGGRLYHVITDYQLYFGEGKNPVKALYIWEGGLGIWGAVALGALGAWLALKHQGLRLAPFADALAPGLIFAQAIGRWGNYFNQELYGRPTTLPWGLRIDDAHLVGDFASGTLFHPTFLYESLWCVLGGFLLLWLDHRYDVRGGRLFAIYAMIYTAGRVWIENLRIDAAHHVLGLRLNVWTALVVFLGAWLLYTYLTRRAHNDPHASDIYLPGHGSVANDASSKSVQA
ncbi:MAG: prolipoprotein diacylglyceryl transferase [Actinomycetaceae bacterium]|nr:prolipoprotein diacylglyceryl transferase [Actinomycetaceae bacterium]MDY6083213.1 prolipoprotein diacylglyceryl transferase [Actinomycetaceae bacterium]